MSVDLQFFCSVPEIKEMASLRQKEHLTTKKKNQEKNQEKRHKVTSINDVEQDSKCKTRPYHHERDSVWKKYDKY